MAVFLPHPSELGLIDGFTFSAFASLVPVGPASTIVVGPPVIMIIGIVLGRRRLLGHVGVHAVGIIFLLLLLLL